MTAAQEGRIRAEVRSATLFLGGLIIAWGSSAAGAWQSSWVYLTIGLVGMAIAVFGIFTRPGPAVDDEAETVRSHRR